MDGDDKHPNYGQFTVVEETVLTQEKSLEDSTNIIITWGKLVLIVTGNSDRNVNTDIEHEARCTTNKEKQDVRENVKEKQMKIQRYSKLINEQNRNKIKENDILCTICEDIDSVDTERPKLLDKTLIKTNHTVNKLLESTLEQQISDEDIDVIERTKTPIKITLTQNKKNSVTIREIENDYYLTDYELNTENSCPVIEEEYEKYKNETMKILKHQVIFEEILEVELEEINNDMIFKSQETKNNLINSSLNQESVFNFDCQRNFELVGEENKIEFTPPVEESIYLVTHESSYSLNNVIHKSQTINYHEEGVTENVINQSSSNAELNEAKRIKSKAYIAEEEIKENIHDKRCFTTKATSDQASPSTTKMEIYLFLLLMFSSLLLGVYLSIDNQAYTCHGDNTEEQQVSCTLDGYVELSRINSQG